jgi:hypothetical protein
MTTHDTKAFDPLIPAAVAAPAERLRAICRQLAPAHRPRNTSPVLDTVLPEASMTDDRNQLLGAARKFIEGWAP